MKKRDKLSPGMLRYIDLKNEETHENFNETQRQISRLANECKDIAKFLDKKTRVSKKDTGYILDSEEEGKKYVLSMNHGRGILGFMCTSGVEIEITSAQNPVGSVKEWFGYTDKNIENDFERIVGKIEEKLAG